MPGLSASSSRCYYRRLERYSQNDRVLLSRGYWGTIVAIAMPSSQVTINNYNVKIVNIAS